MKNLRSALLVSSAVGVFLASGQVSAQEALTDATVTGPQEAVSNERVVVVGSQIAGAEITGALPVTVVGVEEIEATGAVSAEELFRTIPQAGDITFNGTYLGGGNSNAARGDVSTVSLRGLAQGNTLSLINGRRSVLHPTSQTDNQTPVFGYNVNAIPVSGMERVEVLKDGAAALYGSDAVAGVVNNVLRSDFVGLDVDLQYGVGEGTNLEEITGNILYGTNFADGRGNISFYLGGTDRTSVLMSDQAYTASADKREYVVGTPWEGAVVFDSRSTSGPWGVFTPVSRALGTTRSNGVAFTDATGAFHVQAPGFGSGAGCPLPVGGGVCYGPGSITGAAFREMRYNSQQTFDTLTTLPAVERLNAFSFINYDLNDDVRLYGELGFYKAQTEAVIGSGGSLGSAPITIAADAYWNPLGPVGSPNRLPGLSANVPAEGVPLTITAYSLVDVGTRDVVVDNEQYRILAGAKGEKFGWDWDSAILYSEATVSDQADGYSSTLFQQALNRTDPTAYNPFSGGDPANPSVGDPTGNNQDTIDSFRITQVRSNKTTLGLVDFKVSKPDLFTYWAGDVGIAGGVEYRRETYHDDRDPLQDGSTPFFDSETGLLVSDSGLMGHSPSPDVKGSRNVTSTWVEFAVPLVSEDWGIPLVQALDLQLAGRYEDYSDVGSVAKPKAALSWDVVDGLKFRGSWSEGFKAPNLEVVNTPLLERVNGYPDYIQCEAALRQGRITSYAQCSTLSVTVASLRSGNANLVPEESTSYSYGMVFEPTFLPPAAGDLTFTVDKWHIEQENVIGLLTDDVALNYDYFLRLQGGSNPNVLRLDPTPQQIANFAGTGLDPVGDVVNVIAAFTNLAPLEVEGVDFGLFWNLEVGPGDLSFSANASNLETYYQSPTAEAQILLDAKDAGQISPVVNVSGGGSLIEDDGRPKWKYSTTTSYSIGNWQFGVFTQYTGLVYQNSVRSAGGDPWKVGDQMTANVYVQYEFENDSWSDGTKLRVGARNITNEEPPFAQGNGYLSSLYQPLPRYWYVNVKKSF